MPNNPILSEYFFTNVYRELDPGTQYILDQVEALRKRLGKDPSQSSLVRMVVVYRLLNRRETFQDFGGVPYTEEACQHFCKFLETRRHNKKPSFSNGHQNNGYDFYYKALSSLEKNMNQVLKSTTSVKNLLGYLIGHIDSVGEFFAQQICNDLVDLKVVGGNPNEWVCLGPGAKRGLLLMYPDLQGKDILLSKAKYMQKNQQAIFKQYGLQFPFLEGKNLSLVDIEHALCEFSRYHAATTGKSHKLRKYKSRE